MMICMMMADDGRWWMMMADDGRWWQMEVATYSAILLRDFWDTGFPLQLSWLQGIRRRLSEVKDLGRWGWWQIHMSFYWKVGLWKQVLCPQCLKNLEEHVRIWGSQSRFRGWFLFLTGDGKKGTFLTKAAAASYNHWKQTIFLKFGIKQRPRKSPSTRSRQKLENSWIFPSSKVGHIIKRCQRGWFFATRRDYLCSAYTNMYTNNLQHRFCLKNSPVLEGLFISYQNYWTTVDGRNPKQRPGM